MFLLLHFQCVVYLNTLYLRRRHRYNALIELSARYFRTYSTVQVSFVSSSSAKLWYFFFAETSSI